MFKNLYWKHQLGERIMETRKRTFLEVWITLFLAMMLLLVFLISFLAFVFWDLSVFKVGVLWRTGIGIIFMISLIWSFVHVYVNDDERGVDDEKV